jgi:hypothetical protein
MYEERKVDSRLIEEADYDARNSLLLLWMRGSGSLYNTEGQEAKDIFKGLLQCHQFNTKPKAEDLLHGFQWWC